MAETSKVSAEQSGAFVEMVQIEPTGSGPLDGLTFAVKDIVDVAGHKTGCGNPTWRETHPSAITHALCVEQLLATGARGIGKTVTDEFAFSLTGENHHYGTPLNPKAPGRVPGGSSSGSASAVACGLVDFAIGTDTGGSVRVPASNCGIFGLRPSHGAVSVAGVMPFAPTFDSVGLFARNADVLARAAAVLLECDAPARIKVGSLYTVTEALALADPAVLDALAKALRKVESALGAQATALSLRDVDGEADAVGMQRWHETFCTVQWAEIWSSLGSWITDSKPVLGPTAAANFELTRNLDRRHAAAAVRRSEAYCRGLAEHLGPNDLLCIPTAPTPAPLKGSNLRRDGGVNDYYPRALSLTSLAGIGRLPQVSIPLLEVDGLPVGLSLIAARGQDAFLLRAVQMVARG